MESGIASAFNMNDIIQDTITPPRSLLSMESSSDDEGDHEDDGDHPDESSFQPGPAVDAAKGALVGAAKNYIMDKIPGDAVLGHAMSGKLGPLVAKYGHSVIDTPTGKSILAESHKELANKVMSSPLGQGLVKKVMDKTTDLIESGKDHSVNFVNDNVKQQSGLDLDHAVKADSKLKAKNKKLGKNGKQKGKGKGKTAGKGKNNKKKFHGSKKSVAQKKALAARAKAKAKAAAKAKAKKKAIAKKKLKNKSLLKAKLKAKAKARAKAKAKAKNKGKAKGKGKGKK